MICELGMTKRLQHDRNALIGFVFVVFGFVVGKLASIRPPPSFPSFSFPSLSFSPLSPLLLLRHKHQKVTPYEDAFDDKAVNKGIWNPSRSFFINVQASTGETFIKYGSLTLYSLQNFR